MTKLLPAKSKRTDETRQKMRNAAVVRHTINAERIRERVILVLDAIEKEISENHGIYPSNKGTLSLAEVARRAGIHPLTFHKPKYQELTERVREWLHGINTKPELKAKNVRKGLHARVEEWKQLYYDLLESHRISETDLSNAEDALKNAHAEIDRLKSALESCGNVIRLPTKSNT